MGPCLRPLRLAHNGLVAGQQLLALPEHGEVLAVEQPDVVGHRTGGRDVVRDDQTGGAGLRVEVDDQLVEVRRTHRIETGVGLVEQQDLRVEHQRAGKAGPLAHTTGDLPRQLLLRAGEADHRHLLEDDLLDLRLALLRVLTQREGDVVVQVLRAEQGAVLEQDAEQLADLVQVGLADVADILAVDPDVTTVGHEQPDQVLEEDGLAGAGGPEQHADLTGWQRQGDILPDQRLAEALRQALDLDFDTHAAAPSINWPHPPEASANSAPLLWRLSPATGSHVPAGNRLNAASVTHNTILADT